MGEKHFGRYKRKPKNTRYWTERHRIKNKIKRILRSNGKRWAKEYAIEHQALRTYADLVRLR